MKLKRNIWRAVIILACVIIVYNVLLIVLQNTNEQIFAGVTVVDKARVSYWPGTHKYLIYTIDGDDTVRVFENTDTIFHGKHDSSDYYARIRVGETYTFRVVGRRLPHFSRYKNIIKIVESGGDRHGI